jgi:hypothetical protein
VRGSHRIAAGLTGVLLLAAVPVVADITVIGHYTLASGDTLTRASYYTSQQMRTTLPNGEEILYNHRVKRITLIDHARRLFWEGPRDQADSIATRLRAERASVLQANATPEMREQWSGIYATLGDSVRIEPTGQTRRIANYPCSEWVLTAGQYLRQERWVARSLSLPNFAAEVEKVVLATVTDPVGRGLMKLVLKARSVNGLPLAGMIHFRTLGQEGTMTWEAVRVNTEKIGVAAWAIPDGYARWEPPAAK